MFPFPSESSCGFHLEKKKPKQNTQVVKKNKTKKKDTEKKQKKLNNVNLQQKYLKQKVVF